MIEQDTIADFRVVAIMSICREPATSKESGCVQIVAVAGKWMDLSRSP